MAPKILTPTRKVKVKAGFPFNFEVDFVGEPNPTVDWKMNDAPTPESTMVESKQGHTNLYFPIIKR